jgi:hypothetical protein
MAQLSEVLGNLLELFQRCPLTIGERPDGVLQAMVDMILNQRALGLAYSLFNGVQLLGNIHAGSLVFDHADNAAQVTLSTLQPFDDFRMTLVLMFALVLAHRGVSCNDI